MERRPLIIAKDLSKDYLRGKKEVVKALNNVNVEIREGQLITILGPSGSGKTTLLNILSGIDSPTEGKVLFDDENIAEWDENQLASFRIRNVGFVFQSWELIETMTALENVEVPLYPSKLKYREIRRRSLSL